MPLSRQDRLFRISCLVGLIPSRTSSSPHTEEKIEVLTPWHLNHRHGQDDYVIYAVTGVDQTVVGKLQYSVFKDVPNISWIETAPDYLRRGIGRRMIEKLSEEFPYEKIKWGYTTPDGSSFRNRMNKLFKDTK